MWQTEFEFTLPKGYLDSDGNVHRIGIMRLAKAIDEIVPLRDPRVKLNPAYATVIILSSCDFIALTTLSFLCPTRATPYPPIQSMYSLPLVSQT